MNTNRAKRLRRLVRKAYAFALAAMITGMMFSSSSAQGFDVQNVSVQRLADLETAFWVCDHTATRRGIEYTPMALCAAVTDELKAVKFRGDFDELVAWWTANKPAQFERLDAANRF